MTHSDIPGFFFYHDFYRELAEKCPPGEIIVEVGCWLGCSLVFLADKFVKRQKFVQLFGVDTFRGSSDLYQEPKSRNLLEQSYGKVYRMFLANIRACGVTNFITPMPLPSIEAAHFFDDRTLFAVFIDADHSTGEVKSDIRAWKPKIKPGGILAGHDYDWDSVKVAVDELLTPVRILGTTWIKQL